MVLNLKCLGLVSILILTCLDNVLILVGAVLTTTLTHTLHILVVGKHLVMRARGFCSCLGVLFLPHSLCWVRCLRQEIPAARSGASPGQRCWVSHALYITGSVAVLHLCRRRQTLFLPASFRSFHPFLPSFYLISCLKL